FIPLFCLSLFLFFFKEEGGNRGLGRVGGLGFVYKRYSYFFFLFYSFIFFYHLLKTNDFSLFIAVFLKWLLFLISFV
ncbi:hypothetical protein JT163_03165, partial [Helicobacter pylori]|nr:hypothetical protein [Helicobacter pylori]